MGENTENVEGSSNAQTIPLLEAVLSPDPDEAARGGIEITIINQNSIMSTAGPEGTMADVTEFTPNKDQISLYVVRKGDTITQIAKMFDVSTNTILWANDLKKGASLKEGQKLVILPLSGVQYTIKKGDKIGDLAKKFSGDAEEIISFNDLPENGQLTVGEVILIPNGEFYTAPEKQNSSNVGTKTKNTKSYRDLLADLAGYFLRPTSGRRTQGLHGYNAIDIAKSCGEPILASAPGEVVIAKTSGWNTGAGKYVVIIHPNGTQSLYAHMSDLAVSVGDSVSRGQTIGYMGHTGHTIPDGPRGCHLHFEIRGAKNPF